MLKNGLEKIKQEGRDLRNEFRERTLSYVLAGFGLVAGLAWNEAIKTGIEYLFPMKANNILAKLIYAILITALLVIISIYLSRLLKSKEEKNQ